MSVTTNRSAYYEVAPNIGTTTYIARSPNPDRVAALVKDVTTIAVAAPAASDLALVVPALPAGCKVGKFAAVASTALDTNGTPTLTASLGWTSAPTAVMAAAAAFRDSTTVYAATDAQLLAQTASAAGDDLLLKFAAGAATGAAGTITVMFELIYP